MRVWEFDVPLVVHPLRWFFCPFGRESFHFVSCIPPFLLGGSIYLWLARFHHLQFSCLTSSQIWFIPFVSMIASPLIASPLAWQVWKKNSPLSKNDFFLCFCCFCYALINFSILGNWNPTENCFLTTYHSSCSAWIVSCNSAGCFSEIPMVQKFAPKK